MINDIRDNSAGTPECGYHADKHKGEQNIFNGFYARNGKNEKFFKGVFFYMSVDKKQDKAEHESDNERDIDYYAQKQQYSEYQKHY